jgi:hypothetical protein
MALTEASPITPPLGHLAFLAAALDEVGKTLHQARGGSEDLAAVTKWIDWSRDLIAQHQATIAELSPRVVGGRDHEAAFAFPTSVSWSRLPVLRDRRPAGSSRQPGRCLRPGNGFSLSL